jgi:hypothetical protein
MRGIPVIDVKVTARMTTEGELLEARAFSPEGREVARSRCLLSPQVRGDLVRTLGRRGLSEAVGSVRAACERAALLHMGYGPSEVFTIS